MVNKSKEFSNSIEIDEYFIQYGYTGFVDWFNKKVASDFIWGISIKKPENWHKVWGNIKDLFGKNKVNLIEFLCLNSILINETDGNFLPLIENIGSHGSPGISYAFNKIDGIKVSYNTLTSNKSALTLFNDPLYIAAHSTKPFGSLLKNTTDSRWGGETFPLGFSGNINNETNTSGKLNGFLYEADFMKFRGRGYIQLIGRENYKSIISYVKSYTGNNLVINSVKDIWKTHTNIDDIATISTNQQWDDLFQKTDSIIANYTCYLHSLIGQYKNYNIINPYQSDANLYKSIYNVGLAVGGTTLYAREFENRVMLQLNILDSIKGEPTSPTASISLTYVQEDKEEVKTDFNNINNNGANSVVSHATNLFKPTIKPGPISFNMGG